MKYRLSLSIIALTMLISACSTATIYPLSGDIVFCHTTATPMGDAITNATASDSVSYDHVGIVARINDSLYVIEATPRHGVVSTEWNKFLRNNSNGITVMRLNTTFDTSDVITRALSHVGKPYDWSFRLDNNALYCSELIYESYRDCNNNHIFHPIAMNFYNSDGSISEFWTTLFHQRQETIPQGEPGSNPNDIARSPLLHFVTEYKPYNL